MSKVQIKDIFELQMGKTPSRKNYAYWTDGAIDWVSIRDLGTYDRYVGCTKEHITQLAVDESGIKPVPPNTLIMSFKLSLGKTAITVRPTYTNEAIMAFIDKGRYSFDLGFLFHQFSAKDWTAGTNMAVMGATLNKKTLSEAWIELPDEAEQRRIASMFDSLSDRIIDARDSQRALDELVKSRFVEMFGDPVYGEVNYPVLRWNDVFETKTGKLDSNQAVEDGQYPFFTCSKEPLRIDTYAFDCEALLLAGNNAAGKYDVKHYMGKFNAYQRTYVLRLLNPEWRYELFKLQLENQLELMRSRSLGTNTRYLTLKILGELEFIVPPLALQQEFAAFVQQVDKLKFETQQAIDKLQMLYDSLAQEYFGS